MATLTLSKIILLVSLVQIQLFGVNCVGSYISGCKFVHHQEKQQSELFIVCTDDINNNKTDHFIAADQWKCDSAYGNRFGDQQFYQMDIVSFEECSFKVLPDRLLYKFAAVSMLNVTNVGLEKFSVVDLPKTLWKLDTLKLTGNELTGLDQDVFKSLSLLKRLDLSVNKLTQFPSFADNPLLEVIGLMFNKLKQIPDDAFEGLTNLKQLGLSSNELTSAALKFDENTELEALALDHNPIEVLKVGDFEHVKKLKVLSINHARLRQIELGTFSTFTELTSLTLSDNELKEFDVGGFLPAFPTLQILKLDGNRLTELDNDFDQIFLRLNELVITRNQFNCTYLKEFLKSLRFLRQVTDTNDSQLHNPNIRGISCKHVQFAPDAQQPKPEKVQRGFESGYNVSIFILVLWISLTNLVICGVVALVGRRALNVQQS